MKPFPQSPTYNSSLPPDTLEFVAETLLDQKHPRYRQRKVTNFTFRKQAPFLNEDLLLLPSLQVPRLPEKYLRQIEEFKALSARKYTASPKRVLNTNKKKAKSPIVEIYKRNLRAKGVHDADLLAQRKTPAKFQNDRMKVITRDKKYQKELSDQISIELSDSRKLSRVFSRRSSLQFSVQNLQDSPETPKKNEMQDKLEALKRAAINAKIDGYEHTKQQISEFIKEKALSPHKLVSKTRGFKEKLAKCRSNTAAKRREQLNALCVSNVKSPKDAIAELQKSMKRLNNIRNKCEYDWARFCANSESILFPS